MVDLDPSVAPFLPLVQVGVAAVKTVKNVYLGLQDLLTNFKRIILPESLKVCCNVLELDDGKKNVYY